MLRSFLFVFLCFSSLYANNDMQHILLLQSYNKGLVWSDNLSKGVDAALQSLSGYELSTEYLDAKRNKDKTYKKLIREAFIHKFKNQNFDVVIAADNAAIEFVLKYKEVLFKNTPLVFTGIEKAAPGIGIQDALDHNISVILEQKPLRSAIEGILQLIPDLKFLYVINDQTDTAIMINGKIKEVLDSFSSQISYQLYLDGNLTQISKDIQALPPHSAIWFGNLYLDPDEKYIPYYKVKALFTNTNVPIFAMTDTFFGQGVIGGHLLDAYPLGYEAGKKVLALLHKKSMDYSHPVLAKSDWMYDYAMLKKHHLEDKPLPKDAIVINLPKTFFERNRKLIDRIFIAFPFVFLFLLIALLNIYKRRQIQKQLIAQNQREKVLLNNIHSAIFWVDTHGIICGCNQYFYDLFTDHDNVLGQKICDILKPYCQIFDKKQFFEEGNTEFTMENRNFISRSKTYYNEAGLNSGVVTIINDVTEKKQLEINKQFIIQQSKLSEIGEMLSAIVHQWKVPLVDLSVVAHKMQRYHQKDRLRKEDIDSFFEIIMKQIIYMGDTIDNFRNFVRPSNKPVAFDIDTGVHEIMSILEASMKYNKIKMIYNNSASMKYVLFGYPNEFKQVLLNIINNAKDAIVEARKDKKCGVIYLDLIADHEKILVTISDDGNGFEPTTLVDIFNPFFSTKEKGDGFGLYMAKLIIENKMQGIIEAKNIDRGAQISISLPLQTKPQKLA